MNRDLQSCCYPTRLQGLFASQVQGKRKIMMLNRGARIAMSFQ